MRSGVSGIAALGILFVLAIIAYSTVFTVRQTEQALIVRLGEPVKVITEPGLNFKIPFVDTVISVDKRILDLENPAQEVIASDRRRLVVDAFARYRITDALKFYQTVGSVQTANIQLATCSPNFLIQESIETWQGFHAAILMKPIRWSEGYIIPPTEPGLGVELNEEYIQGFPYRGTQLHLEMGAQPLP